LERFLINQFSGFVERIFGGFVLDQFDSHQAALVADAADNTIPIVFFYGALIENLYQNETKQCY